MSLEISHCIWYPCIRNLSYLKFFLETKNFAPIISNLTVCQLIK